MKRKALILIGFQNDYFSENGILNSVVEESIDILGVVKNTKYIIEELIKSPEYIVISTPINFSDDYSELVEPVGILKTIKDVGAFKKGMVGSEVIPEIKSFGEEIIEVQGKKGLNAFIGTKLEEILNKNDVEEVILAGCVCSICIDSTGRSAAERGYKVTMVSDCITGRTMLEHDYYMENVFPLYAAVNTSAELLSR
jgi:nicotinamidase-related amidase